MVNFDTMEELSIDNDPVHADLTRAINCIEDAIKFLDIHSNKPEISNILDSLRRNLQVMLITAKRLDDACVVELERRISSQK